MQLTPYRAAEKIIVQTKSFGHRVELSVSDTGSGLTQEECERLFTPYYTTKQHGTGLGLAIVQSVVVTMRQDSVEARREGDLPH